ncbi:MAG: FMN-binding protein [Longimicrobiaceae bacterium]
MSATCHDVPALPAPPPADAPTPPQTASARLIGTMTFAGAVAGLLIVLVFQWAQPRIAAHQAQVLGAAVQEVLAAPARTERLWIVGGRLSPTLPAGADSARTERVWAGYDAAGRRVGFAVLGAEAGFADVVTVIFGYEPASKRVLGMKVLDNKETPGLGDRIVKDTAFGAGFHGRAAPLAGVKRGAGKGAANEVDMITGATISSRTVIGIINHRVERVAPLLEAWTRERRP